ncbi:MAG: hypothetical protein N2483_10910, partial [Burkholderiaceae bacterium]|nr:hypothetical protein [Burkholderiaceae bacterium]
MLALLAALDGTLGRPLLAYLGLIISYLVLNLPLVGLWARIALIPFHTLGPLILLCSVIGAYSIR